MNPLSARTVNANGPMLMFWSAPRSVVPSASNVSVTAGDTVTPIGRLPASTWPSASATLVHPGRIASVAGPALRRLLPRRVARRVDDTRTRAAARDRELLRVLQRRGELLVVAALQERTIVEESRRGESRDDAEDHDDDDELHEREACGAFADV